MFGAAAGLQVSLSDTQAVLLPAAMWKIGWMEYVKIFLNPFLSKWIDFRNQLQKSELIRSNQTNILWHIQKRLLYHPEQNQN